MMMKAKRKVLSLNLSPKRSQTVRKRRTMMRTRNLIEALLKRL